ncbi:CHD5 domain protein, putative [Rhizoctonia solani AG-3 Rhs1AP]|uniref:CHD5 domain protein, putative n=1 Tax=Rhizoctonia solani AG-3 Rhs1AP TaxID=1086054 RepID=X8IZW4_9AGAM|nr:CHD5 domain protein, putative [Rhizoctonia solani AG-3 Rhs1AP]
MGTPGYSAYRYKGKYHREYLSHSAYPTGYGSDILACIPRNPVALEKWIAKVTSELDEESDGDMCTDASWTLGDDDVQWIYVIDFDNRVFTVNGILHFKFDNLPRVQASSLRPGFAEYLEGPEDSPEPKIPEEHLTSLTFWPQFTFDAEKDQQEYSALQPTVATLSEWNAPTWDTLSVSQHLSVSLIKTLVYDYSGELALCYYSCLWDKLGVFCWKVANAAATSHLLCPPVDTSPQTNTICVLDIDYPYKHRISSLDLTTHCYLEYKGASRRFCWFRGCLVTFCPRLDDPAYMTHKVVQMIQKLRKNDRIQGVGVIMSGWHVVAVTVNGSEVRHSPVLELHDGKEPKDGALLLMHLLSPTFTRSKAPWLASLSSARITPLLFYQTRFCAISSTLPILTHTFASRWSRATSGPSISPILVSGITLCSVTNAHL